MKQNFYPLIKTQFQILEYFYLLSLMGALLDLYQLLKGIAKLTK